jgi:ribosomal protein S12 methylthiotransferase accessory factor
VNSSELARLFSSKSTLAAKRYYNGTHRAVSPAETLERVRPYMSAMGITRIANVTGLDRIGIPVVMVTRPNSRELSTAQGKGVDLLAAAASGLLEAVERHHAESIACPTISASYDRLRDNHKVVDVDLLAQPADSEFDQSATLAWIEGYDLLQDEPVLVPSEVVRHDLRVRPPGSSFFTPASDGLAAGNHAFEAVSHAICELVERDAMALWELENDARRAEMLVDIQTVSDPMCSLVLQKLDAAGVAVVIWDTTTDVALPAFSCCIADDPTRAAYLRSSGGGFGCHPSREIALLRALTEAAQSRLTAIAGSRDDFFPAAFKRETDERLVREAVLELAQAGRRPFQAAPTYVTESADEDLMLEFDRLRAAGLERAIVIDLSRRELGIPVVRVIIPGLEKGMRWPETRYGKRGVATLRRRLAEHIAREGPRGPGLDSQTRSSPNGSARAEGSTARQP